MSEHQEKVVVGVTDFVPNAPAEATQGFVTLHSGLLYYFIEPVEMQQMCRLLLVLLYRQICCWFRNDVKNRNNQAHKPLEGVVTAESGEVENTAPPIIEGVVIPPEVDSNGMENFEIEAGMIDFDPYSQQMCSRLGSFNWNWWI